MVRGVCRFTPSTWVHSGHSQELEAIGLAGYAISSEWFEKDRTKSKLLWNTDYLAAQVSAYRS
jgi:hypothetical protein